MNSAAKHMSNPPAPGRMLSRTAPRHQKRPPLDLHQKHAGPPPSPIWPAKQSCHATAATAKPLQRCPRRCSHSTRLAKLATPLQPEEENCRKLQWHPQCRGGDLHVFPAPPKEVKSVDVHLAAATANVCRRSFCHCRNTRVGTNRAS